ncbi:MAG: arginine deiminase family protein [Gemmatimonadota bacterium]
MGHTHGADSETGRLRSALLHRPGSELTRVTPRSKRRLLFGRLPWLARAQEEHDAFAQALRDHGVEVLYLTELLQDVLEYQQARTEAIASALGDGGLGDDLRTRLAGHLHGLDPESLARVLVAGLTQEEFPAGRGLVYGLLERGDFVIEPLPSLVFTRDSSAWLGHGVAVASLPGPARSREPALIQAVYAHHPRFAGAPRVYGPGLEQLAGGDLLQLAPGVTAAGIGGWTSPAGVERLARRLFAAALSHAVLVVPTARHGITACLDTLCTVVEPGTLLMHPGLAYTLTAHVVTPGADGLDVSRPQPFLEAAAQALGTGPVRLLSAGTGPFVPSPELGDDGGGVLAIGSRQLLSPERNVDLNARLEAAGIEVIRVPGSELGGARSGPRCLACPVGRDPAAPVLAARPDEAAGPALAAPHRDTTAGPGLAAPPRPPALCPPERPAAAVAAGAAPGPAGQLTRVR